ncbi:homocitrate synthase/isopropylmalate synthase family protein [Anaeromicropila populeti]|uniref:Homocitrate synthase NifV n=1 Tax=Anaeromicropila populeti TaxID=37658 RepID=A0A1I6HUX5_9FIRM|nr:hypothetical protein [Anaeromicropila populeti]SFR58262.1 homocitrate synthase NifV [Anaeromicropila populeti]
MIRIIDATLATLDHCLPTREQLILFCDCMKTIGITDLEISQEVYQKLEKLPEGFRFYVKIDASPLQKFFRGIHRFICHNGENTESVMSEFQLNDIREIVQLRAHKSRDYVRIVGLDDLLCHNYEHAMKEIRQLLHRSKINFCPENTYGCASALAVQWILTGGSEITTSFAGSGNLAATEEVLMALRIAARYKPNQDITSLVKLKELYETITGKKISPYKPVIGNEIFHVESGIHVDGIAKNPSNYEAYPPESVGQTTKIILGKHSGTSSVEIKLKELGMGSVDQETTLVILRKIKKLSMKKRDSLSDEEFNSIVREVMAYEGKKMDC